MSMSGRCCLFAAVALVAASSCGDEASGPETVWKVEFRPGAFGVALVGDALWLGVAEENATATSRGELIHLDVTDGSIEQRVAVDGTRVVGVVDDTLWVQSGLFPESLDPVTGELGMGGLDSEGQLASAWSLASAGGRLFGRSDGELYEMDPATGAVLAPLTLPLNTTANTPEVLDNAPLAGAGDLLLIDTTHQGDEAIAALDVATGEYRWVAAIDRTPVGMVVLGDRVWVALQQPALRQRLVALDLATGEELLDARLPEGTSMLDDGNQLLVAAADGTLWLLVGADSTVFRVDTETGEVVEQFRFSVRPTTFVVTDDAVLAVSHIDDAVAKVARTDFELITP
jgi:outer membrane protein assembly factor BamB